MFKKKDIFLITAVILITITGVIFASLKQQGNGSMLRITINGDIYGEYPLSEDRIISINEKLGQNKILIENGSVSMVFADCPDKYCMDYEPISKRNEIIICLPHRLVVEVVGERNADLDAVS